MFLFWNISYHLTLSQDKNTVKKIRCFSSPFLYFIFSCSFLSQKESSINIFLILRLFYRDKKWFLYIKMSFYILKTIKESTKIQLTFTKVFIFLKELEEFEIEFSLVFIHNITSEVFLKVFCIFLMIFSRRLYWFLDIFPYYFFNFTCIRLSLYSNTYPRCVSL